MERIADVYGSIPGVLKATPVWNLGDGSSIFVTPKGKVWHYVFDRASGDCIAGCTHHQLYYFAVSASGSTLDMDEWEANVESPMPQWAQRYWKSRRK